MANQKISQLTEQTDLSLIDGLAGYEGTSNVRISGQNIIDAIPTMYSGDGNLLELRTVNDRTGGFTGTAGNNSIKFNFRNSGGILAAGYLNNGNSGTDNNLISWGPGLTDGNMNVRGQLALTSGGGAIKLKNSGGTQYLTLAQNTVNMDPAGDVTIEPTGSGKIQVKQSDFQWNGTGSTTFIRSNNLPDYYLLMPNSNIHYNLYSSDLAPNGKSFIGWIGGKMQMITGHPSNATHGGFIELTSKGNYATLRTLNAADWGDAPAGQIDPGGKVTIDSAAENVEVNVRPYGSIKIGTELVGSVGVNFSGATDGQYNNLIPGTSAGVTTNGDGIELRLALTISGGVATSIRVSAATSNSVTNWDTAQGRNFKAADRIIFASSTFGGTSNCTINLTAADVEPAYIDLNGPIKQQGLATLSGTTPSWDIRTNYNAELTINAAGSTLTIEGALPGDYGTVIVDSSASTSLTFPTGSVYPGGTAPTLTGTSNKDVLSFLYDGTNYYWTSALDFS